MLAGGALLGTLLGADGGCHFPGEQSITIGSKALWIANGTDVLEYLPEQLRSGTSATAPHLSLQSAMLGSPQGVTFDVHGNLWVVDPSAIVDATVTPALLEFTAAQLSALGSQPQPTPVATITSTAMSRPQQALFDSQGNLWITDHDSNSLVVFSAGQLALAGAHQMTPAVVVASVSFNGPAGITLDGSGNLWVANEGGAPDAANAASAAANTIVEFEAGKLPAVPGSGVVNAQLTPSIVLSDDGADSIQSPWGLAFDADGNLWSSNSAAPSIVEFAQHSLTGTGAPKPFAIISPTTISGAATLDAPHGVCFDDAHNLAVMNSAGDSSVAMFGESQLKTGAVAPATFLVGAATTLSSPIGCTFAAAVN